MTIHELTALLQFNSCASLRIALPTGEFVPAHFHITEVGRIDKKFIDCGGTRRSAESCLLQVWVADDTDHRLVAGKLAKIIELAAPLLGTDDLVVEVEYGAEVAAQYVVSHATVVFDEVQLALVGKQTDCLAREKCGVADGNASGCC